MRVPLWEGTPPGTLGAKDRDLPFLDLYPPNPERAEGAAMLIFPGGAYSFLSPKSGERYGRWLANEGIYGIVVNFRLGSAGYRYPALLADAWRAFDLVRSRHATWGIDPRRIGVIGTSAGGHLASVMLTGLTADGRRADRPALGVLCYPVVSMRDPLAHQETRGNFLGDRSADALLRDRFSAEEHVDGGVPPCFVWHTLADEEVTPENSIVFAQSLQRAGVPYELHLYQTGPHALGLAEEAGLHWSADCMRWLRGHGFLSGKP